MKKKYSGPTRRPLESARLSLESGGRDESNGVFFIAGAYHLASVDGQAGSGPFEGKVLQVIILEV